MRNWRDVDRGHVVFAQPGGAPCGCMAVWLVTGIWRWRRAPEIPDVQHCRGVAALHVGQAITTTMCGVEHASRCAAWLRRLRRARPISRWCVKPWFTRLPCTHVRELAETDGRRGNATQRAAAVRIPGTGRTLARRREASLMACTTLPSVDQKRSFYRKRKNLTKSFIMNLGGAQAKPARGAPPAHAFLCTCTRPRWMTCTLATAITVLARAARIHRQLPSSVV